MTFISRREKSEAFYAIVGLIISFFIMAVVVVAPVEGFGYFQGLIR